MSKLIPWDLVEEKYAKNFKETPFSHPAKPARMAIGTQIIKEKAGDALKVSARYIGQETI